MQRESPDAASDPSLNEARDVAMARYDLSAPGALALFTRLARRHTVDVRVVTAAIVAAAVARRAAGRGADRASP